MYKRFAVFTVAVATCAGARHRARRPGNRSRTAARDARRRRARRPRPRDGAQDAADRRLRRAGLLQRRRKHHRRSRRPRRSGRRSSSTRRTIDLEHWRTRVQQRLKMDFVFASTVGQLGLNRTNETLDGDVAYNIGGGFLAAPQTGPPQPQPAGAAAARQRRVELLAHPITIVRAALDPDDASCRICGSRATCSWSTSPCARATR